MRGLRYFIRFRVFGVLGSLFSRHQGKSPAFPSEVSKLVADEIPASVNPVEQEFDGDAGEELDIRKDMDKVETITFEVGPSLLADVEAISRKGAAKVTKKELLMSLFGAV